MRVDPAARIIGHVAVPGDKSISHRAVLLGAIADGETSVRGFGRSGDTEATIAAVRALGVTVDEDDVDSLRIEGVGLRGLREPDVPLDCGNSGTTMRLLPGILAHALSTWMGILPTRTLSRSLNRSACWAEDAAVALFLISITSSSRITARLNDGSTLVWDSVPLMAHNARFKATKQFT